MHLPPCVCGGGVGIKESMWRRLDVATGVQS